MEPHGPRVVLSLGEPHGGCTSNAPAGVFCGQAGDSLEGSWLPSPSNAANYDVSRDGDRFLMLKPADEDQGARQIVVVQNWFEELIEAQKVTSQIPWN
jgi:hypothetical protein